jgi:hypothetical protein
LPQHRIEVTQPPKRVLNSDVRFTIYSDDQRLGELSISRGSIDWRPANRRKPIRRSWEWFAQAMEGG